MSVGLDETFQWLPIPLTIKLKQLSGPQDPTWPALHSSPLLTLLDCSSHVQAHSPSLPLHSCLFCLEWVSPPLRADCSSPSHLSSDITSSEKPFLTTLRATSHVNRTWPLWTFYAFMALVIIRNQSVPLCLFFSTPALTVVHHASPALEQGPAHYYTLNKHLLGEWKIYESFLSCKILPGSLDLWTSTSSSIQ